jgi:hypothetical protein
VCSLRSKRNWFALCGARVLSNYEARNQIHVFYLRASPPRARCLTLALPPNGGGPGSHLRFTEVTVGCPLATRARGGRLTTLERACSNPPLLVARTLGARGSGIKKSAAIAESLVDVSSLRSSRGRTCTAFRFAFLVSEAARLRHGQDYSSVTPRLPAWACQNPASQSGHLRCVRLTLARLHRLTSRQASALFRPRPMTDLPALRPLHSTPRPLQMKQAPAAFVPPAANWQDSQKQLGRSPRRRHQWPRDFVRPAHRNTARGFEYRRRPQQ